MDHHVIHPQLLEGVVDIDVIGAGGSGSQVINGLARLHLALLAWGHPGGLRVTLWDDDVVSEANVGRQAFYPCDIGAYKAPTLINRINLGFGLNWSSEVTRIDEGTKLCSEIVIGCVDTRKARKSILAGATAGKAHYWLDLGNGLDTGQVVFGEVRPDTAQKRKQVRLPHAADLMPELVNPVLDESDDVPSCSLADALEKQSLFINSTMAMTACTLLVDLFRHGRISNHGSFVNLKTGRTTPLQVNEEAWKRFGYGGKVAK